MNPTFLHPRLASLFLICGALAAALPLQAEDRDDRPRLFPRIFGPAKSERPHVRASNPRPREDVQQVYVSVYPRENYSDPAEVTGEPAKPALQHLEIPISVSGRAATRADNSNFNAPAPVPSIEVAMIPKINIVPSNPNSNPPDVAATPDIPKKELPRPAPKPELQNVPVATRSAKPGFVKSPFEPFNELDATGMYPGMLAKDPTTGKIFRMP